MKKTTLMILLSCVLVAKGFGQVDPQPIPAEKINGVPVGGGFVESYAHEVVRTSNNVVYIITADDNPCQNGGRGVIRAWKGTGAQASNPAVPTGFTEQNVANHPVSAGTGTCIWQSGVHELLLGPDIRLDPVGIIHVAYIDGNNGNLYYQTFSTLTDTWGSRVVIATGAETVSGTGWPRTGQVALTLDVNNIPHVIFASSGTSNAIRYTNRIGGSWSAPTVIFSGTNEMHPSMVTALDGTIHAAWLDNSLGAHAVVKYAQYSAGIWSTPETVASGAVLANGDGDQGPSIATDLNSTPHVLYMVGTVNGADNYVRMRYRTGGIWTDNTPPGLAGASNANGTWYAHTPQNYVSAAGDDYVFLGHDINISPGGYQYQVGGPGNNWSSYFTLDPRNKSNTLAGAPGLDGSASIRFDPLRDNNNNIIDLIYYDENDGTVGYPHHATMYYKAVSLSPTDQVLSVTPTNLSFSAVQGGGNPASDSVNLTNAGTGALSFTAVSDTSWLSVLPGSGSAPQVLKVSANVSGLAQGSYTGHITVTSSGAQGSPATVTVTLTVSAAPTLSSLTLNPVSVVGGASSTGTATLNAPAPTGGAAVAFVSNSPSAQVPASVLVPSGATTANFTVTTSVVSSSTSATITGKYGSTQTATLIVTPPTSTLLFGDQTIESGLDSDYGGTAEAFQTTAASSGTLSSLTVYLDSTSTATTINVGLYADNGGHPGALLSQGSSTYLSKGGWNAISTTGQSITLGTKYWIAILGTNSGTLSFRDRHSGPCRGETSKQTTLTALPATWTTGAVYADCPVSAYGR